MRVLVVSDIHGNHAAFKAVLKAARKEGYDEALCLGDLVGYGPEPDECVDLALRTCSVVLAGNHDIAAAGGMDTSAFSTHARRAMDWTRSHLSPDTLSVLASLEPIQEYARLLLSHGSPEDPLWSYILGAEDADGAFASRVFDICLFGHTHIPSAFLKKPGGDRCEVLYGTADLVLLMAEGRALLNPGSVGFPRDAADAHASDSLDEAAARYGILDTEAGKWHFCRAEYDMRRTAAMMDKAGLW